MNQHDQKFVEAIKNLRDAMNDLSRCWYPEDHSTKLYPFHKDLMELATEVQTWYHEETKSRGQGYVRLIKHGHLWLEIEYKGDYYSLAYNYGMDATTIFLESTVEDEPDTYINYFHGGFNPDNYEPDDDILENAKYYIDNK